MTGDSKQGRRPPRERFAVSEQVFDLRAIAAGLRGEQEPIRRGHRQMTIHHSPQITLIVFDFEAGARLRDHEADAQVTILALSGRIEVSTPSQTLRLAAGSLVVLDPGVRHDVFAPEASEMLLTVTHAGGTPPAGA